MAIGTPVALGQVTSGGGGSTSVLTLTTGVSAGDQVIVVGWRDNTLTGTTFSDSRSNTYQVDTDIAGTNASVDIGSAVVTTPLLSGDTITATFPSSTFGTRDLIALKVSGLASSGWFEDRSATLDTAFSSALNTTAKANVQADALLVGVAVMNGAGHTGTTSGGSWTGLVDWSDTTNESFYVQYQIVSTVASRSTAITPSGNVAGIAVMMIYKASSAAAAAVALGPAFQPIPFMGGH